MVSLKDILMLQSGKRRGSLAIEKQPSNYYINSGGVFLIQGR